MLQDRTFVISYFFGDQGGEIIYARGVGLAEDVAYLLESSSNKVTSRKIKELWTKVPEWNNAAYEEQEKSHYFTHPAHDTTNSHPHFNQREKKNRGLRNKGDLQQEQEKVNKEKK